MNNPNPTTITPEDGAVIGIGEIAYDYYGMGVVELVSIDPNGQHWCCNCPVHTSQERDNYWGWWAPVGDLGTDRAPWGGTLDGSRVVSVAWAQRIGFAGADRFEGQAPTGWPAHRLPR